MLAVAFILERNQLTLAANFHSANDSSPGIHDTLSQRDDIVEHFIRAFRVSYNATCLLENLSHNREVSLKVTSNSSSNIAKALKDGWLELVGESGTLVVK